MFTECDRTLRAGPDQEQETISHLFRKTCPGQESATEHFVTLVLRIVASIVHTDGMVSRV
jgi:hypothetical protein